jgi:large subunit ribosomal protein L9
MKIILQQDIKGVGRRGDIKDVADGFAMNFLLPQKKAVIANDKNTQLHQALLLKRGLEKNENNKIFTSIQKALGGVVFHIHKKADEKGHLYAAISVADIRAALEKAHISEASAVEDKHIVFDAPIKSLGNHKVGIVFDSSRRFYISIVVEL